MFRFLIFAIAVLVLGIHGYAQAQDAPACVAKDQVVRDIEANNPAEGLHIIKLNGEDAGRLLAVLNALYAKSGDALDPPGTTYVVAWMDRADAPKVFINYFDANNCWAGRARVPKALLADVIEAES